MPVANTIEKFWSYVNKGPKDECWIWQGPINSTGYGYWGLQGAKWLAHRLSYILANKLESLSPDICVCHKCDTPRCVNPNHLFLGSKKENWDDMRAKGRNSNGKGDHSGMARLSSPMVIEARKLYATGNYSHQKLAEMFGVSKSSMNKAIRGDTWSHIKDGLTGYDPRKYVQTHPDVIPKGEKAPSAKLTDKQVLAIRQDYTSGKYTHVKLAAKYGVSKSLIGYILSGKIWRHLEEVS